MTLENLGFWVLGKISECSDVCCCIIVSMMSPNPIRPDWLIVLSLLWRSPSAAAALVCCICLMLLLLACLLAWSICTWLLPHAPCLLHLHFLFLHFAAVQCCSSSSSSRVWGGQNNVKPNMQEEEEEATTNVNRERLNPSYLLSMLTGLELQ